jgi:hypothetical protein
MTPIGQPCTCAPMTWLYFVFVQSVFVFVRVSLSVAYRGRNDLESLLASDAVEDWLRVAEMFLGKAAPSFSFVQKHKSNSYSSESAAALAQWGANDDGDGEQNG